MYCNCHAPKPHFKAEMHDAEVSRVKNGFDLFALNNILNYKQTLSLVIRLVEVYFFCICSKSTRQSVLTFTSKASSYNVCFHYL